MGKRATILRFFLAWGAKYGKKKTSPLFFFWAGNFHFPDDGEISFLGGNIFFFGNVFFN